MTTAALSEEYVTVPTVAEALGLTRQTVYELIAADRLPAEKVGRSLFLRRAVVRDHFGREADQADEFASRIRNGLERL